MNDDNFFDALPEDMDITKSNVEQSQPIIRPNTNPTLDIGLDDENNLSGNNNAVKQTAMEHNVTQHVSSFDGDSVNKPLQIPQISIQAFFETQATAQLFQLSATDRRMSRAHITMQAGGIVAAKNFYQNTPTPNLIVIESRLAQDQLLAALDDLASVCDEGTKVFVLGHENDIHLYRNLVSKGISDYLVLPTSPLKFIETIYNIYHDPSSEPMGKKYAFFGAKGGVGSSSLAHNIGYSIAENIHDSVTIVDMDFAFGTLGLNFNQDAVQDIVKLLKTPERIDQATINKMQIKYNEYLNLLPNISTIDDDENVSVNAVNALLQSMTQNVSNSIVDLPHVWNNWVKSTLIQADQIVITTTPDLACLRNTKNIIDYLKSNRHQDVDPLVVMNQVGMLKKPEIKAKDFADTIGVPIIAEINYDPYLFGTAANNGQMIDEFSKSEKILDQFNQIAQILVGKKTQPISHKKNLFDFFKKKA